MFNDDVNTARMGFLVKCILSGASVHLFAYKMARGYGYGFGGGGGGGDGYTEDQTTYIVEGDEK
jgi:hypothetical protein